MATRTVLSQLLSLIPKREFRRCVEKHRGNHNCRTFSCWDQFVCMVVAQLARKESLREVETCLRGIKNALYHSGLKGIVSRSTLADANERRPSALYAEYCHVLIREARQLYAEDVFVKELEGLVYVLDSTTIKLSLALCPWAYFGNYPPAAMKLHTQLDLKGSVPSFLYISKAKMSDNFFLDIIKVEAGSFYVMDKGYFDLARLYKIHQCHGYFVTRAKRGVKSIRVQSNRRPSDNNGVRSDHVIRWSGSIGRRKYPERLRRIRYRDEEGGRIFIFITNNFVLPATIIAELYKSRWQVEVFFKWIKQNLRLESLFGYSRNAIETQIWTAVAAYLTVAIAKKKFNISASLTEIMRFLPQILFIKMPLFHAFSSFARTKEPELEKDSTNQMNLL